jgi:hypothetical protein
MEATRETAVSAFGPNVGSVYAGALEWCLFTFRGPYRRVTLKSALRSASSTHRSYSSAEGSACAGCCCWHLRRAVETARAIRMSVRSKRSWRAMALAQPTVITADATKSPLRVMFIAVSPSSLVTTMFNASAEHELSVTGDDPAASPLKLRTQIEQCASRDAGI